MERTLIYRIVSYRRELPGTPDLSRVHTDEDFPTARTELYDRLIHHVRSSTAMYFAVYVTSCDLETSTSFSFDDAVNFTGRARFPIHA